MNNNLINSNEGPTYHKTLKIATRDGSNRRERERSKELTNRTAFVFFSCELQKIPFQVYKLPLAIKPD